MLLVDSNAFKLLSKNRQRKILRAVLTYSRRSLKLFRYKDTAAKVAFSIEKFFSQFFKSMAVKQEFKSFEDLVGSAEQPVLVDFYADWCGPCQMMAKILVDVGAQMKGEVKIAKIDTEKYPQIASQHNIHALPTLVLFKGGQPLDRIEGVLTADQLINRVRGVLSGDA